MNLKNRLKKLEQVKKDNVISSIFIYIQDEKDKSLFYGNNSIIKFTKEEILNKYSKDKVIFITYV